VVERSRFKFITVSLANASQDGNEETHVPEYILSIRNTAAAQGRRSGRGRGFRLELPSADMVRQDTDVVCRSIVNFGQCILDLSLMRLGRTVWQLVPRRVAEVAL
jgi:hypothetical protein